jgi:hypothetical protein
MKVLSKKGYYVPQSSSSTDINISSYESPSRVKKIEFHPSPETQNKETTSKRKSIKETMSEEKAFVHKRLSNSPDTSAEVIP